MAIAESDVIAAIQAYTYLSVQSSSDQQSGLNTKANLLYNSAGRTQGNFTTFYAMAQLQVQRDEDRLAFSMADDYKLQAYAYLCQYYFERKFKDWDARSISDSGDVVHRELNGAWQSYQEVLAIAQAQDTSLKQHTDYTNYPREWKNDQMIPETIPFQGISGVS